MGRHFGNWGECVEEGERGRKRGCLFLSDVGDDITPHRIIDEQQFQSDIYLYRYLYTRTPSRCIMSEFLSLLNCLGTSGNNRVSFSIQGVTITGCYIDP